MIGLSVIAIISIYILVIAVLANFLTSVGREKNIIWLRGWVVWLVMLLIPFWDVPIGIINFDGYCEAQSGITVKKRVALMDYFYIKPGTMIKKTIFRNDGSGGSIDYPATGEELDLKKLKSDFAVDMTINPDISRWGYITKISTILKVII